MPRRTATTRPHPPRAAIVLGAIALVGLLGGCVATPAPGSSPSRTSTATATATPTPTTTDAGGPVLVPDGTASENLPLFADVVETVWAGPDNASGRAYIDALVAAGFDKAAMEVTEDLSTVGNRAESLQFSVLWGAECLIGQVGPATGDPVATVVDALAEGGCLIGRTRPIDW